MTTVDPRIVNREFDRLIKAKQSSDPLEMAEYPDFDEEPVPFRAWLRDPYYLGLPVLSDIQMDAMIHAERVYYEPTFDVLGWEKVRSVFEINLAWGKGSGKDYISRIILSRHIYLMLCLASPQGYFGMPGTETISVTNIATAAPQAKHIFFDPWVAMLRQSPYFMGVMEPKAREIVFDKNLLALSGHSSVESQEGQNLLSAVLDEIAAFKTAQELSVKKKAQDREPVQSAEGVVRMARSSIRSRFPQTGKLISISFTRFKNDMIDQLVKKTALEHDQIGESNSKKYASRHATWEVNPLRKRSDFDEDYRDDPMDAQCRYECRPVASAHRFFKNLLAIRKQMDIPLTGEVERMEPEVRIGIEYYWGLDPGNAKLPEGWQVRYSFDNLPAHRGPMAIHMDLGISHDLAGLAGTHVEGWVDHIETMTDPVTKLETKKRSRRPRFVTDFVMVYEQQNPDPLSGLPQSDIQVRWIRQLILELMNNGWVIGLFTADGYQSTDTFQLLQQHGIRAELYSLDRKTEGYDILKNLIYSSDITIPFHPLLFGELESLVKMTETKIDHQAGMSKDMADALAGSARGASLLLEEGIGGIEKATFTGGGGLYEIMEGEQDPEIRHTDVDASVQPRYRPEADGDSEFWSGGSVKWDK